MTVSIVAAPSVAGAQSADVAVVRLPPVRTNGSAVAATAPFFAPSFAVVGLVEAGAVAVAASVKGPFVPLLSQ